MLSVGEKFPQFNVKATVSTDLKNAFVNNDTYKGAAGRVLIRRISPSPTGPVSPCSTRRSSTATRRC